MEKNANSVDTYVCQGEYKWMDTNPNSTVSRDITYVGCQYVELVLLCVYRAHKPASNA